MTSLQTMRIAGRALLRNKLRSFLTALGIIIGVGAVIAMVAIGDGAKSMVEQQFAAMGSNLLIIQSGASTSGGSRGGFGSQPTLTWDDMAAIQREVTAVKYVAPGTVPRVTITGREVGDRVEVTVADEGIGIPAAERDQIFEAYHRAHDVEQYDGHGIGLAVCKKIVERHGGRISARPPLGEHGTRIVFTLPAVGAT